MINDIFNYFGIAVPSADADLFAIVVFAVSVYVMLFVLRESFDVLRSILDIFLSGGRRRW